MGILVLRQTKSQKAFRTSLSTRAAFQLSFILLLVTAFAMPALASSVENCSAAFLAAKTGHSGARHSNASQIEAVLTAPPFGKLIVSHGAIPAPVFGHLRPSVSVPEQVSLEGNLPLLASSQSGNFVVSSPDSRYVEFRDSTSGMLLRRDDWLSVEAIRVVDGSNPLTRRIYLVRDGAVMSLGPSGELFGIYDFHSVKGFVHPKSIALAHGKHQIVGPDLAGSLGQLELANGEARLVNRFEDSRLYGNILHSVEYSPTNESVLALFYHQHTKKRVFKLWNTSTGSLVWMKRFASPTTSTAFSADGRLLAVASGDGRTFVLRTDNGRSIRDFKFDSMPRSVNIGVDNTYLFVGLHNGRVAIQDIETGFYETFEGHRAPVVSVSSNRQHVLSLDADGTVILRNVIGGATVEILEFKPGSKQRITFAQLRPDGSVLTVDNANHAIVWKPKAQN